MKKTIFAGMLSVGLLATGSLTLAGCATSEPDAGAEEDVTAESSENVSEAQQAISYLACGWVGGQLHCDGPGGPTATWAYGFYSVPGNYGYQFPSYTSGTSVNWYNCLGPVTTTPSKTIRVQYWGTNGYYGEDIRGCK